MKAYQITEPTLGLTLGVFTALDEEGAIRALYEDAGHNEDPSKQAWVSTHSAQAILDKALVVTEVPSP